MRIATVGILLSLAFAVVAQPDAEWNQSFGSPNWDELHTLMSLHDGKAFLIGGNLADERPGSGLPAFGENDYYLMLVNEAGQPIWEQRYGGSGDDRLWSVIQLANGDFLLGGASLSDSSGNKTTKSFGGSDYWLIRTDPDGNKLWETTYGGSGNDYLFDLAENPDGSLLLVGFSDSGINGNKTTAPLGSTDGWVIHVDAFGQILAQHQFGTEGYDNLYIITKHPDGGYMIAGAVSGGKSATVSQPARGKTDYYLARVNESGQWIWDTRFGGSRDEQIYAVKPSQDGGFIIGGGSASDSSIDKSDNNLGHYDYWMIKISNTGRKLWDKTYGGSELDVAYDLIEMPDGNIYLAGVSDSPQGIYKRSGTLGSYDYWLCYLDKEGNLLWDKSYGGVGSDALTRLVLTPNHGLILAGHSASGAGLDKSDASIGFNDWWLLRTRCDAELDMPPTVEHCIGEPLQLNPFDVHCASPPCQWVLDRRKVTPFQTALSQVGEGLHEFILRDRNGCIAIDSSLLIHVPAFQVSLGADTIVLIADPVELSPVHDWPGKVTYQWSTGSSDALIYAANQGTFAVSVTNENGCTVTDEVFVCDCARFQVYIANVFQPNDNLNNDLWFVQAQEGVVHNIEQILVSDQWGTIVYQARNILPNDKSNSWDGRFRDKLCNPGVYTYAIKIQYANGKRETLYGTVTIVN